LTALFSSEADAVVVFLMSVCSFLYLVHVVGAYSTSLLHLSSV